MFRFEDDIKQLIFALCSVKTLKSLDISNNKFTNGLIESLMKSLPRIVGLEALAMNHCNIGN
jgi:Ran GTPase-activating protein (RanGAP) involved in mRNA processing and transport